MASCEKLFNSRADRALIPEETGIDAIRTAAVRHEQCVREAERTYAHS